MSFNLKANFIIARESLFCGTMFYNCPIVPVAQTAWMVNCGYQRVGTILQGTIGIVSHGARCPVFFPNSRTEAIIACDNSSQGIRVLKSSFLFDVPFTSSKTTCRISATSCWELKSKGVLRVDKMLHLRANRKLEGSIGTADFSLIFIFSAIDFSNGDNCADSAEQVLQSKVITHSACRMILA